MAANPERIGSDVERLLAEGRVGLPPLPQVVRGVIALSGDPDAGPPELAELIHPADSLTAEVMKSANSVAYGGRVVVASLQQAIARLGTQRVTEICIAACIRQEIFVTKGFRAEMLGLWRRCLATGLFAKEIAARTGHDADTAFLYGLFQRLGSAILLRALLDRMRARATRIPESVLKELDWHFCRPCGLVAVEAWDLPESVRSVIESAVAIETDAPLPDGPPTVTRLASRLASWLLSDGEIPMDADEAAELLEALELDMRAYRELLALREEILEAVEGAT